MYTVLGLTDIEFFVQYGELELMSKYSIAKEQLQQGIRQGAEIGMDDFEMIEAMLVSAVELLTEIKGGDYARPILQYELDNVASDGVFEIQKR